MINKHVLSRNGVVHTALLSGLLHLCTPSVGHAYIGPGLSLFTGTLLLLFVGSLLLAVYALVWFPIRSRLKKKSTDDEDPSHPSHQQSQSGDD